MMGVRPYQFSSSSLFLSLLFIAEVMSSSQITEAAFTADDALNILNRRSFPHDFRWGAGSSAYQNEGAANEGGKGPSIWDTFTRNNPEKIQDHSNGDIASDSYHRYKEDVQILKHLNLDAYRFSISWPRLLPRGKVSGGVNEEGINYYNNLINELLANGIEPYVTLFHWDVPQALEDEYGGFLSQKIVDDFLDYADLCFERFGDRVKYWITINEPMNFSGGGYVIGILAPGRCSSWLNLNCSAGDSGTEPYIVTHNQLLAHAVTVKMYREKYQKSQKGKIGITITTKWVEPLTNSSLDIDAAHRILDFTVGWFLEPIATGGYPQIMKSLVGNRLPKFSPEQANLIKGSIGFLGLNYYTAQYATNAPYDSSVNPSYDTDSRVTLINEKNGVPIGEQASLNWIYVYPKGIQSLLQYVKNKYNITVIYVTENGIDQTDDFTTPLPIKEALNDTTRIKYYLDHLSYILEAIKEGVNVEGYFAWSLLDNFEWSFGYTSRFGMYYTDYKDGQKRYPKLSTQWLRSFLQKSSVFDT